MQQSKGCGVLAGFKSGSLKIFSFCVLRNSSMTSFVFLINLVYNFISNAGIHAGQAGSLLQDVGPWREER